MSRRADERKAAQQRRRAQLVWAGFGALLLVALVGVVVIIGGGGDDEPTSLGGSGGSGDGLVVSMTEFAFDPDPVVLRGEQRSITVVNDGAVPHDFVVPELGKGTPDLESGEELTIDLSDQPAGTYEVICDIEGHAEAGMVTQLVIET